MKYFLVILAILFCSCFGYAQTQGSPSMVVMTFNTMCDFCKGSNYSEYGKRQKVFQKIIKKYQPDLISFQEFRNNSQLEEVLSPFKDYQYKSYSNFLFSYADAAIVFNTKKFSIIESNEFWLGKPDGSFSFGWKFALPRIVQEVTLKHNSSGKVFKFFSSHFDNRLENLAGSAKVLQQKFRNIKVPAMFAADTNLTVDMPEYKLLTSKTLKNSLELNNFKFRASSQYVDERELCYTRKGKKFPECRVDHILVSDPRVFQVQEFIIDLTKDDQGKYPSDHRPVIVKFKIN